MTIAVVHPDSGNITSICDALERLGRPFRLQREPDLAGIGQILIPGQGRFGAVMRYLKSSGWDEVLRQWAGQDRPLLGICVGMQILFEGSDEDPEQPGLAILPGRITALDYPKRPMIGWSRLHWKTPDYPAGAAYFVNGYGLARHADCIAHTTYGTRFCAAVARGAIMAFQFHPEKSGAWGKELLQQCLIT